MKSRRGVGGLISLVGLVAVFGVVATAFIELNLGQADLMSTTVDVNNLLIDKNNELLNFTKVGGGAAIDVQNLWGKSSTIDSYLLITGKTVSDAKYLDEKIDAGKKSSFNLETTPLAGDEIIFTTNLGKKCLILVDRGYGLC